MLLSITGGRIGRFPEHRFDSVLGVCERSQRVPHQFIEIGLFVNDLLGFVDRDAVAGFLRKLNFRDKITGILNVEHSALYAVCRLAQKVKLVTVARKNSGHIKSFKRPMASNTGILSDVYYSAVWVFVRPHAVNPFTKFPDCREKHKAEAPRTIQRFLLLLLGCQEVLRSRDGDGNKNRDDAAYRLDPSGRVLAELYLAGDTEQCDARCKAQRHQHHVNENRRPVDSMPRFHVDLPLIHDGRIRTPLPIGEG